MVAARPAQYFVKQLFDRSNALMVKAFIISDIRFYREGLSLALQRSEDLKVVGVAATAEGAIEARAQGIAFDVALVDVASPNATNLIRGLHDSCPEMRIVALGLAEQPDKVLSCAEAGIAGYVGRESSLEELSDTIRRVARGEFACPPRIAVALMERVSDLARGYGKQPDQVGLTPRELDVLRWVDCGMSNKQIAGRLNIEVSTVKNHVHNAIDKLGVERRGQAAAIVRRAGLLFSRRDRLRQPTN